MKNNERGTRKVKQGEVVSNKMANTVVVKVSRTVRHSRYGKVIQRAKKFYAHHELEKIEVGDKVTIVETRPISKLKRWRVIGVNDGVNDGVDDGVDE